MRAARAADLEGGRGKETVPWSDVLRVWGIPDLSWCKWNSIPTFEGGGIYVYNLLF